MSRILFVSPPELGHVLPVLPIARQLRERGHEVIFLCTAEMKWLLERYHFMTELWLQPSDHPRSLNSAPTTHIPSGASFWYDFTRRSRSTKLAAIKKKLETVAMCCGTDYFVMDSLFALSFGLDCMTAPFFGRVTLLGTSLARWDDLPSRIPVPLLYLCPEAFEVPAYVLNHPRIRYCEPSCSQPYESSEDTVPLSSAQRSFVLISCGTQVSVQRGVMGRLRSISDVANSYKDIDFIMVVNDKNKEVLEASHHTLPGNVVLKTRVPQRKLLLRARAFITHGGLSSMKEAILAGVPMIVAPEVFDQPFNAMRAVHHGLAPAIFPDEMNGSALEWALRGILQSSRSVEQIEQFQSIFARADANPQAAEFIEDHICSKRFI